MADALRKLVCCMILLVLAGTVSAGFGAAEKGGTGTPVAHFSHGNRGLPGITGESGVGSVITHGCYFPVYNLPAYYICIMVCKIGGGGDRCAPGCEAKLSICT